jgi:hypothetical protein
VISGFRQRRIIATQEKNLAAQTDNQKSQGNRKAIAEKQLKAFEMQRKTLESALRSEKIRAFKQNVEARVRLLKQDVRTSKIDAKKGANKTTRPDTKLIYRGSQHGLTALIVIPKGALIRKHS